jgi:hypothetical protein
MGEQIAASAPKPRRRRFRILRLGAIVAVLLVVLIAAAPWIVAHTGLRDEAINTVLASPSVKASTAGASLGWFSPLSVEGLHLRSTDNRVDIRMEAITADRPFWQLWSSSPDLGTLQVERVHVLVELPLEVQILEAGQRLEPTFTAVVKNATLKLRLAGQDDTVIEVDDLNLTVRIEHTEHGRMLTVDPIVLFERRQLSPKLASKLIHLCSPTVHDTPQLSGAFSLSLSKLRIPLGVPRDQALKQVEIEGKLVLHDVSAPVTSPLALALVRVVADMNGKHPSEVVHLAHNAEIRFEVRDGRLYHDGLRIGFPDIDPALQLTSRGSVGLDKTLDLFVELPRLDPELRKALGPAKCRVTGTLARPKITVEDGSLVLHQPKRKDPIVGGHGMALTMQVESTANGPMLSVEPVQVFNHAKLSLGVGKGLLKWLAPDFDSDRQLAGEISLSFSKLRLPLGDLGGPALAHLEAEGKLTLHQVSSEIQSPLWLALLRYVADMNGKKPPQAIHLIADSEIRFEVKGGRLHYDGLRLGFPEIDPALTITTRGSIGLDDTLDLVVELPRLDPGLRQAMGSAICRITGTLDRPTIAVQDGSLVLRQHGQQEPIIAVHGLALTMHVESTKEGPVLAVDPVEVLKKAKVNLRVASGLLKWIAPDVDGDREVSGEVSLSLSKLRLPLGDAGGPALAHVEAEGKLTLHQVSSEIKSPLWQGLLRYVADLNGKKPPQTVRLSADSEVHFEVKGGRLHYDGLRLGFPEIDPALTITSSGSLQLDETLDLVVELPRLRPDKPAQAPLKCRVSGSVNQPKIEVADAALIVLLTDSDKAALSADNLNLTFTVETVEGERMLKLAPVVVFKKQKLTPAVGDELLHLIAPTLADLAGVQGEFSLSIDTFAVPLGASRADFAKKVALAGKLQLHDITVSVKTPLLQTLVKLVADMHGKKPSDVVRVVQNAEVQFKVQGGRLYHEGLRFGFPDISPDLLIKSQGSVGFDKSLDLVLEVPRVLVDLKDSQPKKLDPVRFRITGTLAEPIVTVIQPGKDK